MHDAITQIYRMKQGNPQLMITSLLERVERWLNAIPTGNIDQNSVSPATIIEGRQNPRDGKSRVAYGTYALVYIGTVGIIYYQLCI